MKLKYVPNILSTFRILLVPVFAIVFFSSQDNNMIYAILIFLVASATDVLDGYIARRYDLISKVGTVLDPLADKLMLITVLTCLYVKDYIPLIVIVIIAIKEIFLIISGILLYFLKENLVIPSNKFGKLATVVFFLAILSLLFRLNSTISTMMVILAIVMKMVALGSYIREYLKVRNIKR